MQVKDPHVRAVHEMKTKTRSLRRSIIAALLIQAAAMLPAQAAFWNLTGAVGAHDPTIIKEGNLWWCFSTGGGLPIKFSGDGKAWTQGTQRFASPLSWWRTYAPNMGN